MAFEDFTVSDDLPLMFFGVDGNPLRSVITSEVKPIGENTSGIRRLDKRTSDKRPND